MVGVEIAIMGVCMLANANSQTQGIVVASPDGQLSAWVGLDEGGQLTYRLNRKGETVVAPSPLGVTVDAAPLGRGVSLGRPERWGMDEAYLWRGVHSIARNQFKGAKIPVTHTQSGTKYTLEVRVFNDGMGLRYTAPGEGKRRVAGEDTAFTLPAGCGVWYQTNTKNYEGIHERHTVEELKQDVFVGPPAVIELPKDGGYMALTEAALFNYPGMTLRAVGGASRRLAAAFEDDREWELEGTITSPWRVIIVASDLNGLVNSDIIPNLNEPPAAGLAKADWIRRAVRAGA